MLWPVAFEHAEFLVAHCVKINLAWRYNVRIVSICDATSKDRRFAGALLTPPRGTDSLSTRCLDTCCFVVRQLLGNRGLLHREAAATFGHFPVSSSWSHCRSPGPQPQICVGMVTNGENKLGFSWVGLTREIDFVLQNIA